MKIKKISLTMFLLSISYLYTKTINNVNNDDAFNDNYGEFDTDNGTDIGMESEIIAIGNKILL